MPELAEVEYFRKQWNPGLKVKIVDVQLHPKARIFRGCDVDALQCHLLGTQLVSSKTAGKQMMFRTRDSGWLGIHLGMSGELRVEEPDYQVSRADHLVLVQSKQKLVFSDFRMFGRVQFSVGKNEPSWWSSIAPALLSAEFTRTAISAFTQRRAKTAIKSVLLMQERFPGIGNWMADEILWRAGIHPKQKAGALTKSEVNTLHKQIQWVCQHALATIGKTMEDPPETWLFPHRWGDGGTCPRTGSKLAREMIGGRMTCWSPARQKLHV